MRPVTVGPKHWTHFVFPQVAAECPGLLHHPHGQRGRGLGGAGPELHHERQEAGHHHCSSLVTISLSSLGRAHRGERYPGRAGGGDRGLRSVQRLQLPHCGRSGQLRGQHHSAPPRLLEGGRHRFAIKEKVPPRALVGSFSVNDILRVDLRFRL